MNHVPARHARRLQAGAGCLVLVSLLAAGCGDDGGDAEAEETVTVIVDAEGNVIDDENDEGSDGDDVPDDSGPALTQEQLEVVVLTPENVGEGWAVEPSDSDEDDEAPGCFSEIDAISDALDPLEVAEHEVEYGYGDARVPVISSGASSYEDGHAVAQAIDDLESALVSCTSVTGTDGEGNSWDVTVTSDDTKVSDATDDQINVTTAGTVTNPSGHEFDLTIHQTYVRIGKNVITIGVTDFSEQAALHEAYTQIAIDRFIDVIIDSEPDQTTGPQPT